MLKRKPLIFCAVVIAIVALFAATQAVADNGDPCAPSELGDGICCPSEAQDFQCFEDAGYVVEISPCDGQFPCTVSGNSVFEYRITKKGSKTIKDVDLLLSVCTPTLEIVEYSTPKWILFTNGEGDSQYKFGRGLTRDNTGRFGNYKAGSGTISLTISGAALAEPKAMGLMITADWRQWGLGEILAPTCPSTAVPQQNETSVRTFRQTDPVTGTTCELTVNEVLLPQCTVDDGVFTCPHGTITVTDPCGYSVVLTAQLTLGGKAISSIPVYEWFGTRSSPGEFTYCYPSGYCVVFTF